jgi:hypothetical protein
MKKSTGVESEPERSFASGLRSGRRLVCPAVRSSALTAAGLSPGRPDEGVWACVCTFFRALGFHPRSFCERFLGNRHRRPFSAQGLGQIRAKQP